MSCSWTIVLALPLLVLFIIQGCIGEDQGSLHQRDAGIIAAMKGVREALGCISKTVQHNSVMMSQVKQQVSQQSENMDTVKRDIVSLQKVDTCTEEVADLRSQLRVKDQMFAVLLESNNRKENKLAEKDKEISDLREQLEKKVKEIEQFSLKIGQLTESNKKLENKTEDCGRQVEQLTESNKKLENKSEDCGRQVEQLTESNKKLQNQTEDCGRQVETLKSMDWTHSCKHPRQQEINQIVQAFSANKDWDSLKTGLSSVLDHNSVEYTQLQSSGSVFHIGYYNQTQLASLLLCAGLSVNTGDITGYTMLHGAENNGHMQLVKFLVQRGADVNAKPDNGFTPIMMAANRGYLEIVKYLVQAGANPTAKDEGGYNALYYARFYNHSKVVQYLEQLPQ